MAKAGDFFKTTGTPVSSLGVSYVGSRLWVQVGELYGTCKRFEGTALAVDASSLLELIKEYDSALTSSEQNGRRWKEQFGKKALALCNKICREAPGLRPGETDPFVLKHLVMEVFSDIVVIPESTKAAVNAFKSTGVRT